jgi:hypothetical protein
MNTGSTGFFIVGEPSGYLLLDSGGAAQLVRVAGVTRKATSGAF